MPSTHERGQVDWKLLLGLVILFFLAGSVIFQHRRIARLERDLSLVRMEVQNVESKVKSRRLSFFEQFGPVDSRRFSQNPPKPPRTPLPRPLRKTEVQPAPEQSPEDLLIAALTGDATALDRLDALASKITGESSNGDDLNAGLAQLRTAFAGISEEAGNGNEDALGLLWRATRKPYLAGIATDAIGHAAALGNGIALELLLNPDQYGILNSSAVGALIEPAQAGVDEAIAALISVAIDPTKSALWYLAATGLQPAAEAGNELAIQTFAALASSSEPSVQNFARMVLENAAANGFIASNSPIE